MLLLDNSLSFQIGLNPETSPSMSIPHLFGPKGFSDCHCENYLKNRIFMSSNLIMMYNLYHRRTEQDWINERPAVHARMNNSTSCSHSIKGSLNIFGLVLGNALKKVLAKEGGGG